LQEGPARLSAAGKDFVVRALAQAPDARPSVAQLLEHDWITSLCSSPAHVAADLRSRSLQRMASRKLSSDSDKSASWTGMLTRATSSRRLTLSWTLGSLKLSGNLDQQAQGSG
jgi:serine/threonine protein kinase